MDLELKGRTALITGSSSGLGKAIALALAQEGADVIINGRNRETINNTATEIGIKSNTNIHSCHVDATDPEGIKNFFRTNGFWLKKLDILVNNVGNLEKFGNFSNLEDKDWMRSYELTFMSMVRFTREALPLLKKSPGASILNIGSLVSHQPGKFNHHYVAAKAAILAVSKQMANEFGAFGIRVNVVCPSTIKDGGWIRNVQDRAKRMNVSPQEAEQAMEDDAKARSPLGTIGHADDVSGLIVFLASDKAKFLTGHCYNVDGGITRSIL